MTDEFVVGLYGDNIRAAHEGLFGKGLVFGTITFGYRAVEVAGPPTRRKQPRCEYAVDTDTADWVRRIFGWFVDERLNIADIVRRLNADPDVPIGPKAVSGRWTRLAVKHLLANPRYVGRWMYGETVTVWQMKQDYSRQVPREEPLREQVFEEFRVVDDVTWQRAQVLLAEAMAMAGRPPKDGDRKSRPRLLNGLFVCRDHGCKLYVGGGHGRMMFCRTCQESPADQRPLFTQLNRALALRQTCAKLAELVRPDTALVTDIIAACQKEAEKGAGIEPGRSADLPQVIKRLTQQITFLMENAGQAEDDQKESAQVLRQLRAKRAKAMAQLAEMEAASRRPVRVPDEPQVQKLLADLGDVLSAAAESGGEEGAGDAREVIERLTGGRIELEQQGERLPQRGWLRGRFRLRLIDLAVSRFVGAAVSVDGVDVVVDYYEPLAAEQRADQVKALYDERKTMTEIAGILGLNRNSVRQAFVSWHESRGLPVPDNRQRPREKKATLSERLADSAKALWDEGLLMQEIAEKLDSHRDQVTQAIAFWFTSRGLPVPDGRTRRKELDAAKSKEISRRSDANDCPPANDSGRSG
jgi:hypothetical protein